VKPLLLACGLPLRRDRPSSFQRQLELLASAWRASGREVELNGPGAEGLKRARAAILLGYPDQFPVLGDPPRGVPLFLWAQCSRPPDPRGFAAVTAVPLTAATADFLHQAGIGRVGPVLSHAVDTGFFRPAAPDERAQARGELGLGRSFTVGAVGAHTYRKRFDLLLQAMALLHAEQPEAVLVLHTDRAVSPEGTDLRRLAEGLGLAHRLRLSTGELPPAGVRRLYWGLDVLACLSEWEGFGLPAAEAMACGLPVLTHGTQGPAELVPYRDLLAADSSTRREGASLLLEARPGTAAGLLGRVAREPGLRRRLGEEGRAAMERTCALPRVLEGWERLLTGGTG
jgi:glycosyltransferase involved in cell wall biosynthesis